MSGNKVANHPTLLDSRMLELAEAPHPQHKQHYFEHLAYLRFLEAKLNILKSKITLDRPTVEQAYRFFNIPSTASYHLFMKALWFQHHHDHGTSWVNNMPQWLEPLKADMLNQRCMTYSHPMPNIDIKAEDPHEVVIKKLFEHINKWMADHRDAQIAHKYLSDIRKVSTSISTASTSEAVTPTKSRYVVFSFLVPVLYDPTAAPKHPFIELGADCYGHVKVESIDVQGGYRHVDIYISEYYWTGFGANNWDSAHTVRLNHLGFVKDVDSFYNEQPEVKRQIQMIQQTKERIEAFTT